MNRVDWESATPDDPTEGSGRGRIIAPDGVSSKTGTRRRWLVLLVVLLLALGAGHASLRQSTGPASGTAVQELSEAAPPTRDSFRFGTFNLHGCVGTDGRYDEQRTAQALEGLDFVGLNEVHGWAWSQTSNQAAALGRCLGAGWLSAPAEERWHCQQFGNGLLTRLPVGRWQQIPLPGQFAKSQRNVVLAAVQVGSRHVQVLLTHLIRDDRALRQQQFHEAAQRFLALEEPAIMAGDLNADGSDPQIQELLTRPGVVDALALQRPSGEAKQIDWVFVRGLEVLSAGVREGDASDHPLVWAELAVPGGAMSADAPPP